MTDTTDTAAAGPVTAPLSKGWTRQMVLIALAMLALGLWGLYDATIKYPERGSQAAEFLEYQYLQTLETNRTLLTGEASIADPKARLQQLQAKHREADLGPGPERDLMLWLEQLSLIGKLDPANTTIPRTDFRTDENKAPIAVKASPQDRLTFLRNRWTTATGTRSASPLSTFDIPFQWIILVVGVGFAVYLFGLVAIAKSKKYSWDAAQHRLTLPNGATLVPADIEEFDKRKWHRLYITLKVRDSHPQLAGQRITIDLKRYEAVEPWVLEMEKIAFPENQAEPQEPAPTSPTSAET
ncbi:MAG TPA: hypothetical protein VD997_16940 [Phycisphaerales bacterium]|nr:hypothetical protein [Phycisphaerales bacterium]